jgi:two-component system, OmpR family, response regulator
MTTPTPPTRVLVVDDEPYLAELLGTALRYEGYETALAGSAADAFSQVARFRPDLVVLDVMLPDGSGLDVCRRLRGDGYRAPVVFLTARDSVRDKVAGLRAGDDYLTKPFSLEELVARIRVILRRTGHAEPESSRLAFSDLELDEETRDVTRGGRPIELTATEYRLLRYLMLNPRRVLTRAQLLDHVWDYDFGGDARVLETYISYLRKKVDAGAAPLIHTVRGVGYSLRLPRS